MLRPRSFLAVARHWASGFDALGGAAVGGSGLSQASTRATAVPRNEFYPRGFEDGDDGGDVLIISPDSLVRTRPIGSTIPADLTALTLGRP